MSQEAGGRYLSLGELVDVEVDFRTYRGKDGTQHILLRVVTYNGEFRPPNVGGISLALTAPR
jgi:hypothetical protein